MCTLFQQGDNLAMANQFNDVSTSNTRTQLHTNTNVAWLAVGRAAFGGYFLFSGINHYTSHAMLAGFAASKGVPAPDVAVAGSGLLLVLGGLSLLLGLWPRSGAALIILFLAGVTPMMHDFWNATDPVMRLNDLGNFLKNIALIGGAGFAAAVPQPWAGSVHADRPVRSRAFARPM
jgi:putative oxidoreductase